MALAEALALVAGAALVLLCATFMVPVFYDPKGALDWINMHVAMRAAFNKISLPQALVGKMRALPLLDGIAESTLDRSTCRPSLAHVD